MTDTRLTPLQIDHAARHLLAARRAGQPGPRIPEAFRPAALEDALAIQRRVQVLLGVATGGWKCSLPAPERALAYAPIFASTVFRTLPCPVSTRGTARIEPEIAFVLGRDLPPREHGYDEETLRAAIAETRLVLEILGSRYAEPAAASFAEVLADQVSNAGLFVGPALAGGPARPLSGLAIAVDGPAGSLHRREGRHPDGNPLRPFFWLANHLAGRRDAPGLAAGQIVTTGSYAGALEVPVGQPITVEFGTLGSIAIELAAAG